MSWYLDSNNLLVHDDLPEPIEDVFSEPYPATFWRLDSDSKLTLNNEDWSPFPEPMDYFTPPYPASIWYLDGDKLIMSFLPEPLPLGAFTGCNNLTSIIIPKKTKIIGQEAFKNTGLQSVTIASDCSYYPESFPPNCEINFYPTT